MRSYLGLKASVLIFALFPLAVGGTKMPPEPSAEFNVERGTLGVIILTTNGIVLAADSRSMRANQSFDDTADKIFRLSENSACTIAGTVSLQNNFFGRTMGFDFPKTIEDYRTRNLVAGSMPMSSEAKWLGLALTMDLSRGLALGTASPLADGGSIGTVVVAGYSKVGSRQHLQMEAYKLKLEVATQIGPTPNVSLHASDPTIVRRYWAPDLEHAPFALFTNGNAQVVLAILGSQSPQFEASRKLPAIGKYFALGNDGKLNEMTLEEAIALAEALINESIRIAGDKLGIGGQIDIATITLDNGFRWVPGHEPDKKRKPTNSPQ